MAGIVRIKRKSVLALGALGAEFEEVYQKSGRDVALA
jgi:hypothetical protein